MTSLLFRDDPELLVFDGRVVERREVDGRPAVVLDRTAFYATSGGQPHDTGTLNGVRVLDVAFDGDRVVHVLDAAVDGDRVEGRVDPGRRRDHLQQHHGQHLLSRAFIEVADARTVAFHLGPETCTVDLDRLVPESVVTRAEARANEIVWSGRTVGTRLMSRDECRAAGIKVPEEATSEAIRIVDVDGWDVQPCSGTHPRRTSDVGVVLVVATEKTKAGTRVRFVCGGRAVAQAGAWRTALRRAAAALQTAPDDVPEAVERMVAGRAATEKELRDLREAARAIEGRELAASAGRLLVKRLDGRDAVALRALALQIVGASPCLVLLGSVDQGRAHFVFARGAGVAQDASALLQVALPHVGGRGGGKPDLAQGGGPNVEGIDAALEAARAQA